jgi:hypothetical protein
MQFEWDDDKAAGNVVKHGVSFNEAPGRPLGRSGDSMKKDSETDELRAEYDFAQMTGGVQGKYAAAYRRGTNLVRLDPDVAEAFTTDESVNEALRAVLRAAAAIPSSRRPSNQRLQSDRAPRDR